MDFLFNYTQNKQNKYNSSTKCSLEVIEDGSSIGYRGIFNLEYSRYGDKKNISFEHEFFLNYETADIVTTYKIINLGVPDGGLYKTTTTIKKNDFQSLHQLTFNGFIRGEKSIDFWGVKYERANLKILNIFTDKLKPLFKTDYYRNKIDSGKVECNELYDLIVNYHLDCKGIKGHDSVYEDIRYDYPKKKWLEKNDYKFIPAVLDSYNIKSKYLISELNMITTDDAIQIKTLNYICKLFGENYIEYLRKIPWKQHCNEIVTSKKMHSLKNEYEKNCLVELFNKYGDESQIESLISQIYKLLSIREILSKKNINVRFNAKSVNQLHNLIEVWTGIKLHISRGFRIKYNFDEKFVKEIEQPIIINDETFKPKILLTEEDFRIEGYIMKNCMAKQFNHGLFFIYVSLQHKRKKINLQYRKGHIVQSYGKANTIVDDFYNDAINALNERFKKHPNISWSREKYDYISDSNPNLKNEN
jgi:hypothetical protein